VAEKGESESRHQSGGCGSPEVLGGKGQMDTGKSRSKGGGTSAYEFVARLQPPKKGGDNGKEATTKGATDRTGWGGKKKKASGISSSVWVCSTRMRRNNGSKKEPRNATSRKEGNMSFTGLKAILI